MLLKHETPLDPHALFSRIRVKEHMKEHPNKCGIACEFPMTCINTILLLDKIELSHVRKWFKKFESGTCFGKTRVLDKK